MALLLAAAVLWTAPPAAAEEAEVFAPVPGTVAVPYWTNILDPCHWIFARHSCDGLSSQAMHEVWRAAGEHGVEQPRRRDHFETCHRPFPPGAYDEVDLGTPPRGVTRITFAIDPMLDWDVALCAFRPPTSQELRYDPSDTEPRWRLEAFGGNAVGEACESDLATGALGIGCTDRATTTVVDAPYKIVAYNWSDIPTARVEWTWLG